MRRCRETSCQQGIPGERDYFVRAALFLILGAVWLGTLSQTTLAAQTKAPDAAALERMLQQEPISPKTWAAWRSRHLEWLHDHSPGARKFKDQLEEFVRNEARAKQDSLPDYLSRDAVAWDLYGDALIGEKAPDSREEYAKRAEAAYRKSVALDPAFGSPHGGLAAALIVQAMERGRHKAVAPDPQAMAMFQQAEEEIGRYTALDKEAHPFWLRGFLAMGRKDHRQAEDQFRQALKESPEDPTLALWLVQALLAARKPGPELAKEVGKLCSQFPEEGRLQVFYAICLAAVDRRSEAAAALDKARQLGVDPSDILGPEFAKKLDDMSKPGPIAQFLWLMGYFAAAYAGVMALMAGTGVVLAGVTRGGPPAPESFNIHDLRQGHSLLGRLYMLALTCGLVLFYVAIPFVLIGLAGGTAALLYGIFLLPQIPVKLVIIVAIVGFGMVVAVLKSIFARASTGSFGVEKKQSDCPQFFQVVYEVGQQVETRPVDQVFVAPGSEIGVHQEGRGPFGVFGVKRRVLTVGLATLRYLNVTELRAVLAHEYAHFSHKDTANGRFIHQVTLSIGQALNGMAQAGGKLNYVNPFYWFFVLYYRAYSLLAAGFSRSREFLADRMAACLYGKDAFIGGLTKVATNGNLFESTAYGNIHSLLAEGKAFKNIYDAFASYRDEQLSDEDREKLFREMLNEKGSMFASHPTVRERFAAIASFPASSRPDETPAIQLFDNAGALEEELTEFLTGYLHAVQQLQARAAAAAGE
jgi:Zn-dependent protease with chaperone function